MEAWAEAVARIRGVLEVRRVLPILELCREADLPEAAARAALDRMVREGEAECLRPVGYGSGDLDVYRLFGEPAAAIGGAFAGPVRGTRTPVAGPGR